MKSRESTEWDTQHEIAFLKKLGSWYNIYAVSRISETPKQRRLRLLLTYRNKIIPSRNLWENVEEGKILEAVNSFIMEIVPE